MADQNKKFAKLMTANRDSLLGLWYESLIAIYPEDTVRFLRSEKNRFANPIGQTAWEGIGPLLDGLIDGRKASELRPFLDDIIRIRAVQTFTAAEALRFLFDLKRIVRGKLDKDIWESGLSEAQTAFETRVDDLSLVAFEVYLSCREQVFEIRVNEMRRRTDSVLERLNRKYDRPIDDPEVSNGEPIGPS